MMIPRSIRGIQKNLYKLEFSLRHYTIKMDLMPDVDNFLQLNAQQRAAVIRMASHMIGRLVVWPADTDRIVHEAIAFRQAHGMHVFPHMEVEEVEDEEEPPAPPGTPDNAEGPLMVE